MGVGRILKKCTIFSGCLVIVIFSLAPVLIVYNTEEATASELNENITLETCGTNADCQARIGGGRCVSGEVFQGTVYNNYCAYPKGSTEMPQVKFEPVAPVLQINIPTVQPFTTQGLKATAEGFSVVPFIGQYFAGIYKWAVMIGGLVAAIMIIFGGFTYLISRGNAQQVEEAKSRITGAIFGLALLLGSYAMLYLINPDLVQFKGLKIQVIQRQELTTGIEPTEINQTKGMPCFFDTFGKTEEEVREQTEIVQLTTAATPTPLKVQVHKLMAPSLRAVVESTKGLNYKLIDTGGFFWRANVNDPEKLSLHSFGIAVDLNTAANPNYFKKEAAEKCKTDMPEELIAAFKANGFSWGGDFKNVCDAMHFEWRDGCKL